jgi:hypothetical protein
MQTQTFNCTLCKENKEISEQTTWVSGRTGKIVVKNRCKACTRKYKAVWLRDNIKRQTYYWKCKLLRERISYEKNRDKRLARRKELYHQKKQKNHAK